MVVGWLSSYWLLMVSLKSVSFRYSLCPLNGGLLRHLGVLIMKIGYMRVSTAVQVEGYSLDEQRMKLENYGCEKIYEDVMSGAKRDRPGLNNAMDALRAGDELVVCKLDRLGRSMKDLFSLMERFNDSDVSFVSLSGNIDTKSITGRLMFNVLGSIAEFERELIMERTLEGIESARANGVKFGRPAKTDDAMVRKAVKLYWNDDITSGEAAKALGVSRGHYYRLISKARDLGMFEDGGK